MKSKKIDNKTGFKVPKDYFKNFEDDLFSELKLKSISPNSGFKVPENYFKSFDDKILKTLKKDNKTNVITLFPWKKIIYATAIAASLIIMFNISLNKAENLNINNIETASIENYILNEGLEPNDIASLFIDEDLSDMVSIKNNLNSETLENYVLDNLDIDDLISNSNDK